MTSCRCCSPRGWHARQVSVRWRDEVALTVVMAAKGYPGDYAKGTEIRGLERRERSRR